MGWLLHWRAEGVSWFSKISAEAICSQIREISDLDLLVKFGDEALIVYEQDKLQKKLDPRNKKDTLAKEGLESKTPQDKDDILKQEENHEKALKTYQKV